MIVTGQEIPWFVILFTILLVSVLPVPKKLDKFALLSDLVCELLKK